VQMAPPRANNSPPPPTRRASTCVSKLTARKRAPLALQDSSQVPKKPKPKPASKRIPATASSSAAARQNPFDLSPLLLPSLPPSFSPAAQTASNIIEIVDDAGKKEGPQELYEHELELELKQEKEKEKDEEKPIRFISSWRAVYGKEILPRIKSSFFDETTFSFYGIKE
jgi:hypothetical protein